MYSKTTFVTVNQKKFSIPPSFTMIQKQPLLLLILHWCVLWIGECHIQKQPLLLLILMQNILLLALKHSKTTFVTVNQDFRSAKYCFSRPYSKTTFVTVNLVLHGIVVHDVFNSKTTFVTVNLRKNIINCLSKLVFKNNLCYC